MLSLLGFSFGGPEIWVIVILVLLLFGGKKIPELMRGMGRGVGELQKGIDEGKRAMESNIQKSMAEANEEDTSKTSNNDTDKKAG
jgi:sec-independent protein translocase protein TatA